MKLEIEDQIIEVEQTSNVPYIRICMTTQDDKGSLLTYVTLHAYEAKVVAQMILNAAELALLRSEDKK